MEQPDPMLVTCVYRIAELPLLPPITFESEAENVLIEIETSFYKALSLWLRNILLAEPLSPEAYEGAGKYYQPAAERWKAELDLIIAVHRSSSHPVVKAYPSPALLWYDWISAVAQDNLEKNGLTGELLAISKREHHNEVLEFCSLLEKHKLQPEDFINIPPPGSYVYAEAQALAKAERRFHHHYLRPFIKAWRNTAKEVKHCKYLQAFHLLPNSSIFMTGKDYKLPPAISSEEL